MLFATAELGRTKARFGLLTMGAGLLVFVLLFQQALLAAILDGMAGAIKQQSGSVIVFTREAKRSLSAGQIPANQAAKVAAVPGVADVGWLGMGLLSYKPPGATDAINVSVIGYQPGKPGTPTGVSSGRLPNTADEIVASAEGAAGRYTIGDTIQFDPGDVPVKVVGLTENALLNIGPALWIPWETYDKLMKLTTPDLKEVLPSVLAVSPRPSANATDLMKDLNAQVSGVDAVTPQVAADSAPGRQAIQGGFLSVMLLCYAVVGIVIGFFFLTMTLQKESSITLLRAVGANARYLIMSMLAEVAVVISGGMVIGVVLLYLVKPMVAQIVILSISPGGIIATAIPALIVALLGTLPPIRRMLRTDPFDVVGRPSLGGLG